MRFLADGGISPRTVEANVALVCERTARSVHWGSVDQRFPAVSIQ